MFCTFWGDLFTNVPKTYTDTSLWKSAGGPRAKVIATCCCFPMNVCMCSCFNHVAQCNVLVAPAVAAHAPASPSMEMDSAPYHTTIYMVFDVCSGAVYCADGVAQQTNYMISSRCPHIPKSHPSGQLRMHHVSAWAWPATMFMLLLLLMLRVWAFTPQSHANTHQPMYEIC